MIDMSGKRGSSFPGAVESRDGSSPLLVRWCCSTNAQPNNSSNPPATAGRLLFFLTIFAGRYTYAAVQNMFKSLQQNRMKRKGASRTGSPFFAICRRRWLRPWPRAAGLPPRTAMAIAGADVAEATAAASAWGRGASAQSGAARACAARGPPPRDAPARRRAFGTRLPAPRPPAGDQTASRQNCRPAAS